MVVDTLQATLTNFFSGGVVQINHATQNQIGTINGITSSHGVVVRDSAGGLVINGNISGGGFAFADNFPVILRTVGDFTINAGASIFTNSQADIFIEAKDGYFINHSGSPFNQGLGSSSGWSICTLLLMRPRPLAVSSTTEDSSPRKAPPETSRG